jgi:hypothetical protein
MRHSGSRQISPSGDPLKISKDPVERRWLFLARSYEFTEPLRDFSRQAGKLLKP